MSAPGHSRSKARSASRRAAAGKGPKPSPRQLKAISSAPPPRNPGSRVLDIAPRGAHRYDDVLHCRNAIRRSGVVPYLNEHLHDHVGSKCRFDAEALLTGMLLTAFVAQDAKRTEVTRTIATMHPRQRFELNLFDPDDDNRAPSYRAVHKQIKRLELALSEGWDAPDGTRCDTAWFTSAILRGSIPASRLAETTAVAIDGTAYETWARTRIFGGKVKSKATSGTYVDAHATYQRDSADVVGLKEPSSRSRSSRGLLGEYGPDGRRIVSADLDARPGWKTATGAEKGKFYLGYEAHLAVAVRDANWRGNHKDVDLGPAVPNYVVGVHLTPSGTNRGDAGMELIDRVRSLAPNINDVVADRGYTMMRPERFLRPLHEAGINVTMDYPKAMVESAKRIVVTQGTHTENMWTNVGTFLHLTVPNWERTLKTHPRSTDLEEREKGHKDFGARAKAYRWSEKERLAGGAIRFRCPICAGRAANEDLNPASAHYPRTAIPVDAPAGMTRCCDGTITIGVDQLDHYQRIPWGTAAWSKSYARRINVEGTNGRLRNELGLHKGVLRAFGTAATVVMTTLLCAALNLRMAATDAQAADHEAGRAPFVDPDEVTDSGDGPAPSGTDPPPIT